jgi:hypothetical protein
LNRLRLRRETIDLALAWLVSSVFSGGPSTLYALLSGGDPLESTRAAGAMLVPPDSGTVLLLASATVVHLTVSLVWALVFGLLLPRRRTTLWAIAGSAAVALLDLRVIAPVFFPSVAALAFWPQLADHLTWGLLLGGTLELRRKGR